MKPNKFTSFLILISGIFSFFFISCEDELKDDSIGQNDALTLAASKEEVALTELEFDNTIVFNWTTGSNYGTNSSIRYTLEMDEAGGDFSEPVTVFLYNVITTFSYTLKYGDLNNLLLSHGFEANQNYQLTVRLKADISDGSIEDQFSSVNLNITTYKPVTEHLYIVGDATPNGWNIGSAAEMTVSETTRGVFVYQGPLSPGNFKFAVNQDSCWCQDFYTRDADDYYKMVYNEGGSGDDLQWTIETELENDQQYRITADLLNLTVQIEIVTVENNEPPFPELWIVGDATESDWNIDAPVGFTQSGSNPFVFSYEGVLNPGNFKIFAGPLGDWCGEWYRPFTDNQALENGEVDQNSGCEVDYKWIVTDATKGRYKIILNTQTNTIQFKPIMLYLIGDGGPNGWNIQDPAPMELIDGEYVFTGPLGADNPTGEFKISKFTGDWCDGDWINAATENQSIYNTDFIYTVGCDGPDNKWRLMEGQAGNYEIRVNLETEELTITPQ